MATSDERMSVLVAQLRNTPDLAGSLPQDQAAIVAAALDGASVHIIAHDQGVSTEAVWAALGNAARLARGEGVDRPVETGGLGSDTDPGVTGGYGDTGFGALDTEAPDPINDEPAEGGGTSGRSGD
jgi:hypothetical protein